MSIPCFVIIHIRPSKYFIHLAIYYSVHAPVPNTNTYLQPIIYLLLLLWLSTYIDTRLSLKFLIKPTTFIIKYLFRRLLGCFITYNVFYDKISFVSSKLEAFCHKST